MGRGLRWELARLRFESRTRPTAQQGPGSSAASLVTFGTTKGRVLLRPRAGEAGQAPPVLKETAPLSANIQLLMALELRWASATSRRCCPAT